jgi:hypothetical protein
MMIEIEDNETLDLARQFLLGEIIQAANAVLSGKEA